MSLARSRLTWQPALKRIPNAFETYSLILLAGALWYVPNALARPADTDEPAFIGPFKGGTRAVGCLMHGELIRALEFNPLAILLIALLVVGVARWLLVVLPSGKRPVLEFTRRAWVGVVALGVALFAAGWLYVVLSESWRRSWP